MSSVITGILVAATATMLYSGVSKLVAPDTNARFLQDLLGLSRTNLRWIARATGYGEVLIGLAAVAGSPGSVATHLALLACAIYSAGTAFVSFIALRRKLVTPCGCFGHSSSALSSRHLGGALALFGAFLAALLSDYVELMWTQDMRIISCISAAVLFSMMGRRHHFISAVKNYGVV